MEAALRRSVAVVLFLLLPGTAGAAARLSITIERAIEGAPITLGVPFPKGALTSPDHVRVLTTDGREVPSQITEVTTWEPVDPSVKWIWVFFFADEGDRYVLEYGADVRHTLPRHGLEIVNNQRAGGLLEATAGPLRFVVQQGETGFLQSVQLDLDGNGFDAGDVIALGPAGRGSFVDLLDDAGVDASRAFIRQTFIERGSGPLHAVLRVEGEYRYARSDNAAAPFVMRIHAYADRPYIKVLHTLIYTGVPDKHRPQAGDYPHVATSSSRRTRPTPAGRSRRTASRARGSRWASSWPGRGRSRSGGGTARGGRPASRAARRERSTRRRRSCSFSRARSPTGCRLCPSPRRPGAWKGFSPSWRAATGSSSAPSGPKAGWTCPTPAEASRWASGTSSRSTRRSSPSIRPATRAPSSGRRAPAR